jgi:hypothetical protein
MADDDVRWNDLEQRRAEVTAWFTDGIGGITLVVVSVIAAACLILTALGLF